MHLLIDDPNLQKNVSGQVSNIYEARKFGNKHRTLIVCFMRKTSRNKFSMPPFNNNHIFYTKTINTTLTKMIKKTHNHTHNFYTYRA